MPILQSRLLAIIIAANDYRQAWEAGERALANARAEFKAGTLTTAEIVDMLYMNFSIGLKDPANSKATLLIETTTIRRNYRDNEARKDRARRHRLKHNIPSPTKRPMESPTLEQLQAFAENQARPAHTGTAPPLDNPFTMRGRYHREIEAALQYEADCERAEALGLPKPKLEVPWWLEPQGAPTSETQTETPEQKFCREMAEENDEADAFEGVQVAGAEGGDTGDDTGN